MNEKQRPKTQREEDFVAEAYRAGMRMGAEERETFKAFLRALLENGDTV